MPRNQQPSEEQQRFKEMISQFNPRLMMPGGVVVDEDLKAFDDTAELTDDEIQAMLARIEPEEPDPDLTRHRERVHLRSVDIGSLLKLQPGCSFHPRCPLFEQGLCDKVQPALQPIDGRQAACHVVVREHALEVAR